MSRTKKFQLLIDSTGFSCFTHTVLVFGNAILLLVKVAFSHLDDHPN